ncbi:MAG: glycosyltransferase family 2 protein [bacterium]|nr:glycosyltransferase family 2 protein [bacterium]
MLEILPGTLSWGTLILAVLLSYFTPVLAAIFIIAFDLYWLLKTIYLSAHLRSSWRRMRHHMNLDWEKMLEPFTYGRIFHLVILPFYDESEDVVDKSIHSLLSSKYDTKKIIVVLASEERAGEAARQTGRKMAIKYGQSFYRFALTVHPKNLPGEMAGKGSNISFAARYAKENILDKEKIRYEDVLVSAFDIDTAPYPQYFLCLTWHYLTAERPSRSSFQPVPLYNNNIWDAPAISRVAALSATFWQMIQQERPEKLATFSSHALSFRALYDIGFWQKNIVSEDSRIFWNALLAFDGDYRVVPISYPVSMDANLAPTLWQTVKNIYKQQRRWTWGVENVPYLLFGFLKNKKIPKLLRFRLGFVQLEGFWSLATNPLIIFLLGWMPLILGGEEFNATVLSYNLPLITRNIMTLAMVGLVVSALISWSFLPKRPAHYGKKRVVYMALQWVLVPIMLVFFGSIPGLDSQTRLMFGKYMGFWVTPKHRKS